MTEGQNARESLGAVTVYPLGKYIVLAELGRGGMAEVYLALSRGPSGFNKLAVLKMLREHLAEDDDFLRMFLGEARLAARLNHPNIVQTYEIGVEGGRNCIVMEYLEGRSFGEIEAATRDKPMALSLGLRVIADMLAGLHHAHERCDVNGQPLGLVHRDVSPHNVFVTYDGQVKILDFGIAKAADDGGRTKTGVFKGKLRYTSPERFRSDESDRRSDIFSAGVMLWQILAKRRLWSGMTELAVMQQLANLVEIPSPRLIDPKIPQRLDEICTKALAIAPADRFQTAAEMQDAIEEVLAAESAGSTNRTLAKFMGEVFGESRQRFQRAVDEQLRAAQHVPVDVELSASLARVRAQQGVPLLGSDGATSSLSKVALPSSSFRFNLSVPAPTVTVESIDELPSDLLSDPPPAPPRNVARALALFSLFAVLAILLVVVLVRTSHTADRAPVSPAPEAVTPAIRLAPASGPGATDVASALAEPPTAPPGAMPSNSKQSSSAGPSTAWHGAVHARPVASAVEPRVLPPPHELEPAKREVDCSSPYFIDDQGMKRIRSECL